MLSTGVAIYFVDTFGRKPLLLSGVVITSAGMLMLVLSFATEGLKNNVGKISERSNSRIVLSITAHASCRYISVRRIIDHCRVFLGIWPGVLGRTERVFSNFYQRTLHGYIRSCLQSR